MTYQEAKEVVEPLFRLIKRGTRARKDEKGVLRITKCPAYKRYFTRRERDLLVRCGFAKSQGRQLIVTIKAMDFNMFFHTLDRFEEEEARGREARWQAFCGGLN